MIGETCVSTSTTSNNYVLGVLASSTESRISTCENLAVVAQASLFTELFILIPILLFSICGYFGFKIFFKKKL
jgi:hypothetical protein